jgi:GT2 family glycosyltransferase
MTNHSDVHVVYVNYNSADLILASAKNLRESHKILVVDNFHSDEARANLHLIARPNWNIIEQANNGFAAGLNAAHDSLNPASGMLLMNPDAHFTDEGMRVLMKHVRDLDLDLVSPQILDTLARRIWFSGGTINMRTGEVTHLNFGDEPAQYTGIKPTKFVSGCTLYISPRARNALFPLRESLFMYYEDVELSLRAADAGLKMWVATDSCVLHDEGNTSRIGGQTRSPLFYYYQARNRLIANIGPDRYSRLASTPWVLAKTLFRIVRREKSKITLVKAAIAGTLDGVRKRDGKR